MSEDYWPADMFRPVCDKFIHIGSTDGRTKALVRCQQGRMGHEGPHGISVDLVVGSAVPPGGEDQ